MPTTYILQVQKHSYLHLLSFGEKTSSLHANMGGDWHGTSTEMYNAGQLVPALPSRMTRPPAGGLPGSYGVIGNLGTLPGRSNIWAEAWRVRWEWDRKKRRPRAVPGREKSVSSERQAGLSGEGWQAELQEGNGERRGSGDSEAGLWRAPHTTWRTLELSVEPNQVFWVRKQHGWLKRNKAKQNKTLLCDTIKT